ncbi:MAG: WYL domain-containing protein [Actinobacteria bacterium]|nr:WYL domain-containing protein [Actinomycetota bacterium]
MAPARKKAPPADGGKSGPRQREPRDKDKLIRQLSLVTYLMAKQGRPVRADDIRRCVEGYDDGTRSEESFARRFYADRDDLGHTGIQIESGADEFGEGSTYRLPPENFFLPSVPFSREEIAALHTCLYLLEGQFAYSRLLRLALQSLALGTGNPLEEPVTSLVSIDMPSAGFDADTAKKMQKLDEAVADRKTIRFKYHSFGTDQTEERLVDPYAMMYTHGDWYMVGHSHERNGMRMFKLRRIRGRIRYKDKKDHNFSVPEDFRSADYLNLESWQLGRLRGTARITFSPRWAWWAGNNLSRSGELESREDGSATLTTQYADGGKICSLVLGHSAGAELEGPPELRRLMSEILQRIARLHQGPPPEVPAAKDRQPGRGLDSPDAPAPQPQVEPDRFGQLAMTVTYLVDKLDDDESVSLKVADVCRDLGLTASELEQAMAALFLVSAGGEGGYLVSGTVQGEELRVEGYPQGELLKRPLRLTPREARAMLLAIDLVGGQILAGQDQSLETARAKIIEAAGGLDDLDTITIGETEKEDRDICRSINRGLTEHRLVEIEYLSRAGDKVEARIIEPYLVNGTKGEWYLVAWCRKRDDIRTFRFEMVKNARLLDETFTPRDIDLDPYRRDPRFPSGTEAPRRATVLFSQAVARWVHETQPESQLLEDGSLLGDIPWFDESWIVDEVLGYLGEAVVVGPEDLRRRIADSAEALTARYR